MAVFLKRKKALITINCGNIHYNYLWQFSLKGRKPLVFLAVEELLVSEGKNSAFDWLIFHYFLHLIFRLTCKRWWKISQLKIMQHWMPFSKFFLWIVRKVVTNSTKLFCIDMYVSMRIEVFWQSKHDFSSGLLFLVFCAKNLGGLPDVHLRSLELPILTLSSETWLRAKAQSRCM